MTNGLLRVRIAVLFALFAILALIGCQAVFGDPTINDAPPADVDANAPPLCKDGDYRCNQEYLLSCSGEDTGWALASKCATSERCDARNKTCTVCAQGDLRCNGADRERCSNDGRSWEHVESCAGPEVCSPHMCGPCTPGEYQCAGEDNNVLRECQPDQTWQEVATCASASLCASTLAKARGDATWTGTCDEPGCDEPGKFRCEGTRLLRCLEDRTKWMQIHVCATEALCERTSMDANANGTTTVDRCLEGCPAAGSYFCNGMALQRCRDDLTGWDTLTTCTPGTECNPIRGECSQLCAPGEYQCNGAQLRRCRQNRTWEVVQTCATAALCMPRANGCQPPACPIAGAGDCQGAQLFECSSDLTAWVPQETCATEALCDELSKRCEMPACAADELRCFGQELKRCNAGRTGWDTVEVCSAGQYCDNDATNPGCKTECPATTRCNGANLETCSRDRGWEVKATCATADLCSCARNNTCSAGVATNGCGVPLCTAGTFQCSGEVLQRCPAGRNQWDEAAKCGSNDLCYAGNPTTNTAGYCTACPTAGEVRCSGTAPGSTLRVCTQDRKAWQTIQTCTSYPCMDNGNADYCAVCNPMEVSCMGDELRRCSNDGKMLQTQLCANVCDASNGGECDDCQAGTAWCTGATLHVCSANGQMETTTDCLTTALCDAENARCRPPACEVGERRCTATGQPQVCNAARTAFENDGMPCSTPAHCWMGRCTACAPDEKKCMGRQPQVCNAMRTGFEDVGDPCESANLCVNGACLACTAGQRRCMGAQPQTCNAMGTGWTNDGMACSATNLCNTGQTGPRCFGCAPAGVDCVGRFLEVCNAMQTMLTRTDCLSEALCNEAMMRCDPPACEADAVECAGTNMTTLRKCLPDLTGWMSTECMGTTPICNATAGRCDECSASSPSTCTMDGTGIRSCNTTTGRWVETPCPTMETCAEGTSGPMCGPPAMVP